MKYVFVVHCKVKVLKLFGVLFRLQKQIETLKMAMWADNVKFVKDIIDSKYQKIDSAIAEVIF